MKKSKIQTLWLAVPAVILLAWVPVSAQNTAYGTGALHSNTEGGYNSAFGYDALYNNTGNYNAGTGSLNTAIGAEALLSNTTGSDDTAAGYGALYYNTTGSDNTASGSGALESNTTGSSSTASGSAALGDNTTGSDNTATGYFALYANSTGSYNTATGDFTLVWSNACCNVADGYSALQYVTSGGANTGIGNNAGGAVDGSWITGNNNTFLGTGTTLSTGSLSNASAIGANAEVGESNALILGSINGVNGQTVTVKVGIGTATPDSNLSVNGSADKPGGGSWGTYSDGRLKNLDGNFDSGLSRILKLHPVRYHYKQDNGMGIQDANEHIGLVAQEVQKVIPEAVTQNSKGYLLVNNDPIIWSMLNAIKEQQNLIEKQRQQIRAQEAKIKAQQDRIDVQQAQGQIAQNEINQVMSRVRAIQASLSGARGTGTDVRRVKTQAPMLQQ